MNADNPKPVLAFDDIWVHSRQPAVIHRANDGHNGNDDAQSGSFNPYALYQKWSTAFNKNTASNKALSIHNQALIHGAGGKLLSGQLTVLTGASGSGKSVLLRVLAGLLPMSRGNIHMRYENAADVRYQGTANPHDYHSIFDTEPMQWRKYVALLAQHPQLLEGCVLDNLQMPYRLQAHQSQGFDMDWHLSQLAQLGKRSDFLYQNIHHLSGGERQLVSTLRLLQLNPQVLLLDEPTAALDSDSSAQLIRLLMSWRQADAQRTMLWVTHDPQKIMPLAHQHWHMQAGNLTEVS